jgi:hypothetical protein
MTAEPHHDRRRAKAYHQAPSAGGNFAIIAFWQFCTFFMLLLLVWVNELLNLPSLLFSAELAPPDLYRGCVLSAGVILTAVITVGHTYVQHRQSLYGLVTVCAKCRKIRGEDDVWQTLESYFSEHSDMTFSHGLCPKCYASSVASLDEDEPAANASTSRRSTAGHE